MKNKTILLSGSSHSKLAEQVAKELGQELGQMKLSTFACGEKYVALGETVRGKDVFLIQTCREKYVNEDFMELFLMIQACKMSFAKRIHVIIPHFGYSRQDKIHVPREPISAKLLADLIVTSGADHVITLALHSDQNQAFFDVPVDNINVQKLIADYFNKKKNNLFTVVSPDAGGAKNAKKFADLIGAPLALLHKTRPKHNESSITHVVGDVKGRTCILFDDMVDTAGSVTAAQKALIESGANQEVYLAATHAIFSNPAIERLKEAQFKEVVVTNSLPLGPSKQFPGLTQISVAPLLADVILSITEQRSVSSLYH